MSSYFHPVVGIYNFFRRHRWPVYVILLLIPVISLWSLRQIHLIEDITEVLPSGGNVRLISKVLNESALANRIVFTVIPRNEKNSNDEALIGASDELTSRLQKLQNRFDLRIDYLKEDLPVQEIFRFYCDNLPYYMQDGDYAYLDSVLRKNRLREVIQKDYEQLISPAGMGLKSFILNDPLHLATRHLQQLQNLRFDEQYRLTDGRIISDQPHHLVFFVYPGSGNTESAVNAELFTAMDEVIQTFERENQDFHVNYFSGSRVATANAGQVKKDVYLTVSIALVMLLLLIGTYFRSALAVLKLFIPLTLAGFTAIFVLSFLRHEISVIALGVGSVLLGISIDFAVHLLVHMRHSGNMKESLEELGPSIWMSCLTTALAFLCLSVIESDAISDLALFAAISIMASAVFTLVILPHFLDHTGVNTSRSHWVDQLANFQPEKNGWIVAVLFLAILISIPFADQVKFNDRLMDLNFMTPEIEQAENEMNALNDFGKSRAFFFSRGTTENDAIAAFESSRPELEKLKSEGVVKQYLDHGVILVSEELAEKRRKQWEKYWSDKAAGFQKNMKDITAEVGFSETAFGNFNGVIEAPQDFDRAYMDSLNQWLTGDFLVRQNDGYVLVSMVTPMEGQKEKLFTAFATDENHLLTDKESVTHEFVALLKSGFDEFVSISLIAVFALLWIFYGRIELAVVTFLPIAGGWSMTLALMNLFEIKFNIFNVMLASFVFGLGVDYCIFTMRGLQQKLKTGEDRLPTYRSSIYLSGFTTIIGTGVLIFARHPAIHSLAFIAIFGIGAVLLLSTTIQPFLFNWMVYRSSGELRARPVTLMLLVNTLIVYSIFIAGAIVLYIVRLVFFFTPLPLRRKKYIFHVLIQWFNWCVVNSVFYIFRSLENKENIDFSRPSVIIANHQSFADILYSLSFHPYLLLQTKDWVWNNLLLRFIIRFADCYPISFGYDQNLGLIRARMKEGYSILIYPEGSRSEDLEIKRFHKGAFYMAEELKADVQPILYHGVGFMMPKREPFLNSDGMSIRFLPRISYSDRSWGDDYQSRTRNIAKYMREEYRKLREEKEDCKYYRRKLISRYIYKGPVTEWYVRIKLKAEDNYQFYHDLLPKSGTIYDVGCGMGLLCHMLKYTSPARKVIGLDYDKEKIELAANAEYQSGMQFLAEDVTKYAFQSADAFVISDVLHYLHKDNQKVVLRACLNKLNPGGILILKDADASRKKQHRGTKISEFFSTRLGFNKTVHALEFMDDNFYREVFEEFEVTVERKEASKLTSNLVYVVRKKQPA